MTKRDEIRHALRNEPHLLTASLADFYEETEIETSYAELRAMQAQIREEIKEQETDGPDGKLMEELKRLQPILREKGTHSAVLTLFEGSMRAELVSAPPPPEVFEV